jgi:hypothetical protein
MVRRQLDQRHQMRRIDRVRHQAAGTPGQMLGEPACHDGRGRGGEDGLGRG